jgi:hypothetical protein
MERGRLAALGADVSLDRQQDSSACFLLFVGHFVAAIDSQAGADRLAGDQQAKLLEELGQIQQYQLLYPAQGAKGPGRVATALSKQSIPQHLLAASLTLDQLASGSRG